MRFMSRLGVVVAILLSLAVAWTRPAASEEPSGAEIADLIDELRDPDDHIRSVARRELVRLGAAPAAALAAAVRGSDWKLRREALGVLVEIGPVASSVAPRLVEFAGHADDETFLAVVSVVAVIDPASGEPIVGRLVELVGSDDPPIRQEALRTIAAFGLHARSAGDALLARLATAPPGMQRPLVEALLAVGVDAIDQIFELWKTKHETVAGWAPAVLAENSDAAIAAARRRLASAEKGDRLVAVTVLGAIGSAADEAVPDLIAALADETGAVRRASAGALGGIGAPASSAVPALSDALADPRLRMQREAAVAIGSIGVAVAAVEVDGKHPSGPVADAVDAGLQWLVRHQSSDGRWDCDGFSTSCRAGACSGGGNAEYDVGVTGLALQCLAGAEATQTVGPRSGNVARAVGFLSSVQDADGCFGSRKAEHYQYNHLAAALGLAELYGRSRSPTLRDSVVRGVSFVLKSQNPESGWRYGVREGDSDTSATGWAALVLKSASDSGIEVDPAALAGAVSWIDLMTDPETGRVGYQKRGGQPARTNEMLEQYPSNMSESLTAVGLVVRLVAGQTPRRTPVIRKGAALLSKNMPGTWERDSGSWDMYYWLYGTRAMRMLGGGPWTQWRDGLVTVLTDNQDRSGGCSDGSWERMGPWWPDGGRVWTTAAAVLCLQECLTERAVKRPAMSPQLRRAVGTLTGVLQSEDEQVRLAAEVALDQLRVSYR